MSTCIDSGEGEGLAENPQGPGHGRDCSMVPVFFAFLFVFWLRLQNIPSFFTLSLFNSSYLSFPFFHLPSF